MHEIEIKLAFPAAAQARKLLEQLGARLVQSRQFEDNLIVDRDSEPLEPQDKVLRLRRKGDRATLTYKAPVAGTHRHRVREEHETVLDDPEAMERILHGLGYEPAYRYQKYRTLYNLDDLEICLDETPIGCYVELEGPPENIDRVAQQLGFDENSYVRESYRELHAQHAREHGLALTDLLLEPEP